MSKQNGGNVLIVSGTPLRNDANLGKTLDTLFKEFTYDNLWQVYFHPSSPNVGKGGHFYRVTEKQLVHSLLGINAKKCGNVIDNIDSSSKIVNNALGFKRKRDKTSLVILRELIWDISLWQNSQLKKWITDAKIDCIFFVLSSITNRTQFVYTLSKALDIPVYLFITDDYYNDYISSKSILRKIHFSRLHKAVDKLINERVKYVFGCSELASYEFGHKYNKPNETLFTPGNSLLSGMTTIHNSKKNIRFFGNVGLGRWEVLHELGKSISEYNSKNGTDMMLEVYSPFYSDIINNSLNVPNGSKYCGFISQNELVSKMQETDIVVHVESFDEEICRRTRLSISTKIADYLLAGKCILAIGKSELASMMHIKDCAFCINRLEDLSQSISSLLSDNNLVSDLEKQAKEIGLKYHNNNSSRILFEKINNQKEDENESNSD